MSSNTKHSKIRNTGILFELLTRQITVDVLNNNKKAQAAKILKEFFNSKQIEYKEISSVEGNIISKIINLIYLLDYASIYHSVISGIDPGPVSAIDFIKERLSK